ncbi:MAG: ATP-dependent DNA helicase RecG [Geobacteraceae bacterium GWC2_55_20]|nr:MAG: ATP-dependent DNA helicase RecG [Geobacteraceae bacterium GWC2_55_20]OGU20320.1 MAG: ATP-dependent DNA helicase RecG [Geobacteraceae bacterium GWF2_54_21]HBA73338.1 DNA helicase RecG [Geobacter sp.]HCE67504.1 DNA helicase RecG [Geobacter sp.]
MNLIVEKDGSLIIPADMARNSGLLPGNRALVSISDGKILISKDSSSLPPSETSNINAVTGAAIKKKNLQTGVQYVKGIGPKLAGLLEKREIRTVEDVLYLLPLRYEDRRELTPIARLRPGQIAVFCGRVISADAVSTKGGRRVFEVILGDDSGTITCKWFHANAVWMKRTWKVGRSGVFSGEVHQFGYQREVHHPDAEWLPEGSDPKSILTADPANFGRIVPVYPLTEGLHQKAMRRIMKEVLDAFLDNVESFIPTEILPAGLPSLKLSLSQVHAPSNESDLSMLNDGRTPAHRAMVFDEFFYWELGLALKKRGIALEEGIAFQVNHRYTKELVKLLPFELTGAQRRVLSEIKFDMMAPHPMHRLVQGDVGSGKTLVALMAALVAVENGYQVAIMAPTEILAEQHWHTIHRWCLQMGIEVCLITAGLKGKNRKDLLERIADGRAQIVVGTHSVIQEKIEFARLGLGIIDEQHRFGVLQRGILKKKGFNPDILVMTATPIPRTLAMTLFGDLSLSVIDEMPPGRIPVETKLFFESRRGQVYDMILDEARQGRQSFIIYPLVEETEKSDLKAASQMAEHLESEVFPSLRIGLLHGRMSPDQKELVMSSFKNRELDVLVSTTVIEVGIDIPNATLMVIEHAERFGLSQLHQLRGRVGRGSSRSRCIMLTPGKLSEDGEKRLRVMESTTDGFRIAEADLEIRGPGDFLGTRQSGMPDFRVADILRDGSILEQARQAAFGLIEKDPEFSAARHLPMREELMRRWGNRLELAMIG